MLHKISGKALGFLALSSILCGLSSGNSQAQTASPSPTGIIQGFTIGVTASTVLNAGSRQVLWLHNPSAAATISCAFGKTAVSQGAGTIVLLPGDQELWGNGNGMVVPGDFVSCISTLASTPLTVEAF